jgi:hypothetical protein
LDTVTTETFRPRAMSSMVTAMVGKHITYRRAAVRKVARTRLRARQARFDLCGCYAGITGRDPLKAK